ncbi:SDR family oxidoreductase [Salinirussus salinus]|uniref:SDR family oxidoreductase n=1 Tax=Salinirussus salinus TaxID=1198300 RepID=UPI00135C820B|nr:SDR family oxidoreductase [Salinirussus salinus]
MSETLDGRTAVVTGASSGIGAESARALADAGATVVLAARSEDAIEEVAADIRETTEADAVAVPTDVTEEAAVEALVDEAVETFGGLDVLVNNAGVARGSDVEEMTTEEYRTMMAVNADGMFFATRAALPHLRETGGTLVFVGSFAGKFPRPFNPVYAATKFWTRGFAQSVSAQVGGDVGVTVINPSEVRTKFGDGWSMEELYDEGEVTEPEEVAEAVVFAAECSPSMVSELDLYRRDKFEDMF